MGGYIMASTLKGGDFSFSFLAYAEESEEEATATRITLVEDMSDEIINGSKHVGFTYNLTEPGVDKLLFEVSKILFENGTILLS
jgi:hypothetical protein